MINVTIEKDNVIIKDDTNNKLGEIKAGCYFRAEDIDTAILDTVCIVLESLNIDYKLELNV